MKFLASLCFLSVGVCCISCYHEQEIPVAIDFQYKMPESFTVPVEITLTNNTTGADFYHWSFEGAAPTESKEKTPQSISYTQAGVYKIKLEAWNDTQRSMKEITINIDSAVTVNFDTSIEVNDFSPVTVNITNHTRGASSYEWTFDGGTPTTSNQQKPGAVTFTTPGDHAITLKVSNGREFYSIQKDILVKAPLTTDFEIIPSFEDEDYEAPLTATLSNHTISGLHYNWSATGGTIDNATDETTSINFSSAGDYAIQLRASNDKDDQTFERTIHVKPNTNLYTITNVVLGISPAHKTTGCFYSTMLRKTIKKDDVTENNEKKIDLVFFAVNSGFSYCRFVSPDSASKFTFPSIPNASHTYFINNMVASSISFTAITFDAMVNDSPLADVMIKENDSGGSFFSQSQNPIIVLFETDDGRKGAIKVKTFMSDGAQSYITADIKVQKIKR